ncbi:demethylmenaquinone methyltransferase / 2-methoxy-6-polyprenyl-1,4-benzoquinol methylase [Balnearium lithotrophicum]|uniref:Demethylmenaquinone methyltransferase / 2-methoxy-6-polyprenyl-1,4-benzoquinol methylase n=1 Tax=Balnearium lithotrophicum TaxID=223788 RepID=A0A521E914_9BACT|nr:class I SAM-dependent methyltransferase [Balnearium lithotrophicum]SMO79660.1 demethylmenaquinone methyltransferase / 2-methoxy-6-polyprenyl-1,4-benzoquinol methylase [Balnearium lithotrophicum]
MKVKKIFNGSFAYYYENVINRISSSIQVNRWRKKLVDGALSINPSPHLVVDFCSGAGNIGEFLLKRAPKTKLVNCDISKPLLLMAKRKLNGKALYVCSDNRFFPIKGESVDIVFSSFCVRNSPEPEKTLEEVKGVLKTGGVFAVLDFFKPEEKNGSFNLNRCIFNQFMKINTLLSNANREAINYLFESIENFCSVSEFMKILRMYGFTIKKVENFMGDVATNIIAVKGGENV